MALGAQTTSTVNSYGRAGRQGQPYMIEGILDMAEAVVDKGTALAANDVIPGLTIPANTLILHAGLECLTLHTGTSTDTDFDFGITGGDLDNFVDDFDFSAAAVGAFAASAEGGPVMVNATDTIDLEIQAMTGTTLTGKIRMFAILIDCASQNATNFGANEVDRDTLA
tara:strand:+ start:698 stop:1201 length:504 start_codon:yes stop_codon:yes gene_type:complete